MNAINLNYSAWLKNKTELKKISSDDDKTKTLLENYQAQLVHDTKRFEMLTKAIESRPALKQIEREVDSAKAELVKAIADDNGGKIMGIDLDKDVANEISSIPRQQSTEAKLAGQYKVAKVDTTVSDGFKVTLEDVSSGELVNASLFDAIISAQHREIIKTAEWSKKPLFVEMTGRRLRGKITDAKVVSVKDLKAQV